MNIYINKSFEIETKINECLSWQVMVIISPDLHIYVCKFNMHDSLDFKGGHAKCI